MHIGIVGYEANIENRVGVNTYAFELLWALYNLEDSGKNYTIYLPNQPRKDLPPQRNNWSYKILPGRGLWLITRLMPHLFLTKDKPDILFSPSHYIPPIAPMACACSIMDLGYLDFSTHLKVYDFWQLKLWSAWSLLVAKYVFAISESTKQEIVNHYPFAKGKVTVTPLGYDSKRFNTSLSDQKVILVKQKYGIKGNYILFLSTLKPSKNIVGLIDAWKMREMRFPRSSLVIAGKKGWLYNDIFRKVRENNLESRIIFTDFVDEDDKPYLVKGAQVFILPSFWEGFGLDALTAMACGVPVIVSNRGSLPEVVGSAGILVDPKNVESIADAITKVLSMDKKDYNSIVTKGISQAEKFSWKKTAEKTLEVLERIKK
ncbi:glycosyltransferase family 4 protein [Candidatus Microgenomates bacterium]|nr:glycosyltransferase family 4 protein [Candidatus Microgenomates bacterium]